MNALAAKLREHWLTIAVLAALAIAYAVLQTPSSGLSQESFWEQVEASDSAVIYFYSNT